MKKFLALALALAAALTWGFSAAAGWDPPEGAVNAEAVVLYNVDTGTVVYEKNSRQVRAAASLTKMMTALLLAESGEDLSATFTIPEGLSEEFDRIQAENGSDGGPEDRGDDHAGKPALRLPSAQRQRRGQRHRLLPGQWRHAGLL